MDLTIAPARQPILNDMKDLLQSLDQDLVVVSGQSVESIKWQCDGINAYRLGQSGNHALDVEGNEMWQVLLSDEHRDEMLAHIKTLLAHLPEEPNPDWKPIEDRGSQITFSPVGNVAPPEVKGVYDPDKKKRLKMMSDFPFESEELVVKIGGSASLDYIHKDRHKGTNVQKLIDLKGWNKDECIYFGDGLFPGGNDEDVIGVIETVKVDDNIDCYDKLKAMFT